MTRIIAGSHRGRAIKVPPTGTRPTSDRAREGLFSTLSSLCELQGAAVLDLYSGSGAIGLEALSRGAARAVMVERDAGAATLIRHNITALGLTGAKVEEQTVSSYLQRVFEEPYDIVFSDPPYELDASGDISALAASGAAGAQTVVCFERSSRDEPLRWPQGWVSIKERRYGEAMLWYGRRL